MGVIIRNGNAYGGLNKDFSVVDNLNEVEKPEKEHLYAVDKKLYYHDGLKWINFNSGDGGQGTKEVDADTNMLISGDGIDWVKGSPFYFKNFSLPADYDWEEYRNKEISILEGTGDMIAISKKSNTDNLNAPIFGIAGKAKTFLEDNTDIDISGNTKIYVHEDPVINIDGEPFIKFDGRTALMIEGKSLLKMDDYAGINMTNSSCINMNGLAANWTTKENAIGGASPYLSMSGNSTFIMNCMEADYAPLIAAGPYSFEFIGRGGKGTSSSIENNEKNSAKFEPTDYTETVRQILKLDNEEEYPYLRIGKGTHILADSNGCANLKFGVGESGSMLFDISSESGSHTTVKFGTNKNGNSQIYMTGSFFKQMSGVSHFEMHNASQFIMRGLLTTGTPWNDQTGTPRILNPAIFPNHSASGDFSEDYERPVPSPLMALYDAPVFVMRGLWPKPAEGETVPSGWTDRAVQFTNNPLFEMIEHSSFIMEANSKIIMKDGSQISGSQGGSIEINSDGIIINGIEISNKKLTQLLALIGE
jgi:hypothetical protein